MSLELKLVELAQAIGADIKQLRTNDGDLTSLPTTAKNSLVAAITEIHTQVQSATGIDDAAGAGITNKTWSADKLTTEFANAVAGVVDAAPATLDTLNELAAALGDNPNFAATIATDLGNRVRFDAAQTLNVTQRAQACANIGVGDPEHSFLTDYTTARDA